MFTINSGNYGEKCYKIYLNTGTAWLEEFKVYAYSESEAIEELAKLVVDAGFDGLWFSHFQLANEVDLGESVDEYAANHGLIACDKGVYLPVARMEEISNTKG